MIIIIIIIICTYVSLSLSIYIYIYVYPLQTLPRRSGRRARFGSPRQEIRRPGVERMSERSTRVVRFQRVTFVEVYIHCMRIA